MDVSEIGVHWGKSLRVKIRIDVTKRLVRGKRVTIEGGKSRWINFKYERLPNFCYNYGLLSYALKNCLNSFEIPQQKINDLQYRAWLRGEPIRRGFKDLTEPSMESEGDERSWAAGFRPEKGVEKPNEAREKTMVGEEHVPRLTSRDGDSLTWVEAKQKTLEHLTQEIHEQGKVNKSGGKAEEREAQIRAKPLETFLA